MHFQTAWARLPSLARRPRSQRERRRGGLVRRSQPRCAAPGSDSGGERARGGPRPRRRDYPATRDGRTQGLLPSASAGSQSVAGSPGARARVRPQPQPRRAGMATLARVRPQTARGAAPRHAVLARRGDAGSRPPPMARARPSGGPTRARPSRMRSGLREGADTAPCGMDATSLASFVSTAAASSAEAMAQVRDDIASGS
jgi:hypothetical protein